LECLNDWTNFFDDAESGTDIIYTDFQKAFDSVAHKRLSHCLQAYGIVDQALAWINAFLTGRRQRVILNGFASSWKDVISGVPQGTILGPILFLFFINTLPDTVSSIIKLFADDCKVYSKIKTRENCNSLQRDVNKLAAWSRDWLLSFNKDKCVVLRIRAAIPFIYYMEGIKLKEVPDQKDLGILINNDLKPTKHIQAIVKKANQRIGMIRRCFTNLTPRKVSILYKSIIRPILETTSTAWNPWTQKDINLLNRAQRKCEKLSNQPLIFESLTARREKADLRETYKLVNNKYKTNASTFFEMNIRGLRGHSQKLKVQYARTEIRRNFFSNRVVSSWNNLSEETVASKSIEGFKQKLSRDLQIGT
jgi:hypothetical protein